MHYDGLVEYETITQTGHSGTQTVLGGGKCRFFGDDATETEN